MLKTGFGEQGLGACFSRSSCYRADSSEQWMMGKGHRATKHGRRPIIRRSVPISTLVSESATASIITLFMRKYY